MSHLREAIAAARPRAELVRPERAIRNTARAAARLAKARAQGALVMPYAIGEKVPGKGIFAGKWQPHFFNDMIMGKSFYVYAAPENLRTQMAFGGGRGPARLWSFHDAANEVAGIQNWHGHAGCNLESTAALLDALDDGSYNGGWFIPPIELFTGRNAFGRHIHKHALQKHLNKPGFAPMLTNALHKFWSCTEDPETGKILSVNLATKAVEGCDRNNMPLNCRPMRAEAITP
jgi:hypothetical protein